VRKGYKKGAEGLQHAVMTRINHSKYLELKGIVSKTKDETISGLIRSIIHNRRIKIYTHDESMNLLMEELARLRGEIRHIGVNINQITKFFNSYPEPWRKEFYAKITFREHTRLEPRINRLLEIISKLAKKWLSE
jgi:hypothetical protein